MASKGILAGFVIPWGPNRHGGSRIKEGGTMTDAALYAALSTLAQVSATLAALIGFLGLWKLDWIRREKDDREPYSRDQVSGEKDIFDIHLVVESHRKFVASLDPATPDYQRLNDRLVRWDTLARDEKWLKGALAGFLLILDPQVFFI
jgi:hypothetical protein